MSSAKNNNLYKKTSFLAGSNSSFIEELYSDYLNDPNSLPNEWRLFFEGLKENKDNISKDISGPSWSPKKISKRKKSPIEIEEKNPIQNESNQLQAKDSVRAIMLIRAYRIRGHLNSDLDPLRLQKKTKHSELIPEFYGFTKKDFKKKYSWMEFWDYSLLTWNK